MSLCSKRMCGPPLSLAAVSFLVATSPLAAQQSGAQTGAPITANPGGAQTATNPAGPVVLQGNVLDPDAALIPGATITLTGPGGKAFSAKSGSDGTYVLRGAPAGTYSLTVTMAGFASYVRQGVRITPGTPLTVNAKLAIQDVENTVNVTTDQNAVSVDQDSNASMTVLKGKDLDALSDDPDELASELAALAGPAAGPNGGQIYIDGFTGGQLPPKSSIREIRVNQNPFSAQYDRPGFGRVEVFTKPGTDKFHGSIQLNGADKSFNTGSVFIQPGTQQPDYHTILSFGSITGPLGKKASFTMNGSLRKIQDNDVVLAPAVYSSDADPTTACAPNTTGCRDRINANFVQFAPQTRYDFSPRVDLALGEKNTLTARFQFEHNSAQNTGIGGLTLPSAGSSSSGSETTLQLSDTQIFSAKVINETRFEYQRPTSSTTPNSTGATLLIQGGFDGGGSGTQTANDVQNHIEVQNYTSVALTKHFLRLGGRLRSTSDSNTTTANANGAFTYTSICDYSGYAAAAAAGLTANCSLGAATPANNLATYTFTNYAASTVSARSTDLGLYAEDDWKVKPNFTFSYGLRYETQNFISDHKDFAPRVSGAYGVTKKTVIRAGAGFFYDRFTLANQLSVVRNNGVNQQQYTLSSANTNASTITQCSPTNQAACKPLATSAGRLTLRQIAVNQTGGFTNLRAPYQIQFNVGVDQQLLRTLTVSVNYQHIRGVHQYNSDVPNAITSAGTTTPLVYQYQSNGVFNQDQLVTNANYRSRFGNFGGYYVLNFAKSDTSGSGGFASTPNRLGLDYGRATFDTRHRVILFGSFTLPHLVSVSPFLIANSGTPYNILSGQNVYQDNLFNNRAVLVPAGTVAQSGQLVKTIGGCGTFATPGTAGITTPAPINDCTGPASFTLNLRVAKTFGFGGSRVANPDGAGGSQGGRQRGGPGGGFPGGGGPGGGGGGRGGGGGMGGGGGTSSGKKYNVTLGAQAQNVFNIADRSVPVGTITSPSFGQSTQLAGNIFTTDSAIRRITLQLSFTF